LRYRYCVGCDKPLKGKQRKWCSDACRTRLNRWIANQPGKTANQPGINDFVRKSTGKDRKSTGNRIVIVAIVEFDDNDRQHEWDGYTLKTVVKQHLMAYLRDLLAEQFPYWTFKRINLTTKRE